MNYPQIDRRTFIGKSLSLAALAAASPRMVSAVGPNERVNIALIGCGGRGRLVARGLIEQGANILYLCDLHKESADKVAEFIAEVQSHKPKFTKDMRHIFDDDAVDAVAIATPDHWHAMPTILACQAGKDVYLEKPHSHNIWEGARMVEAGEANQRIIQIGTQNRSAAYNMAARKYVQSGKLGSINLVKVYNLKPGNRFSLGKTGKVPRDFDWNQWLGAAPKRPWHQKIFGNGWLNYWDFANGDLSSDGVHQYDLAMMLLGNPGLQKKVSSIGGRYAHKGDDSEIPDTQSTNMEFDDFVLTFEMTNYPKYMRKTDASIRRNDVLPYWTQNATRIELYGSELMMTIGRMGGGWQVTTQGGRVLDQMYGRVPDNEHYANFLDCVKTRKKPNADISFIEPSMNAIHIAMIAHRIGNQTVQYDSRKGTFIDNKKADQQIKRRYRKGFEPV